MRYIIAAAVFALVAGIALGFIVSRGLDGSASAAPKAQAVREQNLDGSGFIAVHEQGVADVNVVSVTSGLMEYTHLYIKVQSNGSVEAPPTGSIDLDAELTALGAQGWNIASTESWVEPDTVARVLYTLTRPAP